MKIIIFLILKLHKIHKKSILIVGDYRQSLQQIDVQAIMMKFIEERGTGSERPRNFFNSKFQFIPHFQQLFNGQKLTKFRLNSWMSRLQHMLRTHNPRHRHPIHLQLLLLIHQRTQHQA